MSSHDQRSLDTHLDKVNKFYTRRRNESDEDYSGRIKQGGDEVDFSDMFLYHAGYDLAPSGLRDPKRKFKLARQPGVLVGGPSADDGHPC